MADLAICAWCGDCDGDHDNPACPAHPTTQRAHQRLAKTAADARALWSVRVLDAYVRTLTGGSHWYSNDDSCGIWDGLEEDRKARNPDHWHGPDEDAARLAAATAVWPELPEAVRKEIGERP